MSDALIIALVGAFGSVLGAIFGAVAQIVVARIQTKAELARETGKKQSDSNWNIDKPVRNPVGIRRYLLFLVFLLIGTGIGIAAGVLFINDPNSSNNLLFYDGFDDPQYAGTVNSQLWTIYDNNNRTGYIVQREGILILTKINDSAELSLARTQRIFLRNPFYLEANLMLDGEKHSGFIRLALAADLSPKFTFGTDCSINPDGFVQCFFVSDRDGQRIDNYKTPYSELVKLGSAHILRIGVNPSTMSFDYYVDGSPLGSYTPSIASEMQNATAHWWIGMNGEDAVGYVDNVRLGRYES